MSDALRDHLHDEIDVKEELGGEARDVVKRLREKVIDIVDEYDDTVRGLEALAVLVEDELDGITTKAMRRGFELGRKRPK